MVKLGGGCQTRSKVTWSFRVKEELCLWFSCFAGTIVVYLCKSANPYEVWQNTVVVKGQWLSKEPYDPRSEQVYATYKIAPTKTEPGLEQASPYIHSWLNLASSPYRKIYITEPNVQPTNTCNVRNVFIFLLHWKHFVGFFPQLPYLCMVRHINLCLSTHNIFLIST